MAEHLWDKGKTTNEDIVRFTVGRDRELDLYLAKHDVLGSMAHITMLESIGLIGKDELPVLLKELKAIYKIAEQGQFEIEDGVEDVHSQVELMLTRKLGDLGKKIHSGRSRNDQVLLDMKLYTRAEIEELVHLCRQLFDVLIAQSEKYKNVLMPGYTHLQIAIVVRAVVRGLCRKPCRRYGTAIGSLQHHQPQSAGFGSRLWFVVPAEPTDDDRPARFQQYGL